MFRARLPAVAAHLSLIAAIPLAALLAALLLAPGCGAPDKDVTVTQATETNFFTPECEGVECGTQLKCPSPDEATPDAGAPRAECPPPAAN
jgi:hypothetical protein